MAKLYFRHGPMGSAKTLNLLAVAHNYRNQGKSVFIIKPSVDVRWGTDEVRSRAGLSVHADALADPENPDQELPDLSQYSAVLVDEAQFLLPAFVERLRTVTLLGVPVICYGLRTDFRGKLFPGSARLLELADSIEEVKTTCQFCNRKAVFNMRLRDGVPVSDGAQIQLGGDESYVPSCFRCFHGRVGLPT